MAKVLIGFMGAGKSTVARLLSKDYIDMDSYLEKTLGMPVAQFFAQEGEARFREKESSVLQTLLHKDTWLATGGGVVESPHNRDLLRRADCVIYLEAGFDTLYQRLCADRLNQRPMFQQLSKDDLQDLFEKRQVWYQELAHLTLATDSQTPDAIAATLLKLMAHRD